MVLPYVLEPLRPHLAAEAAIDHHSNGGARRLTRDVHLDAAVDALDDSKCSQISFKVPVKNLFHTFFEATYMEKPQYVM